jgi:choline dehydrogenase
VNESFDVVIVGGGAAGCVLAARLTENADVHVLLLEAGPDYEQIPAELDDGLGHPPTGTHNWGFTSEPDGTSGRTLDLPRGRVIGGSSTTNAAFALRGHPGDYDAWADAGNDGWAWGEVLPSFVKLETDLDYGAEPCHGSDGPLPVRRYIGADRSPLAATLQDAVAASGVPTVVDHNAPGAVGVGPLPVNEVGGRRMGVASTYLRDARGRPNLTIRCDALVQDVVISGGQATGVRLHSGDTIAAGQVILAGGTYASPALLLRSGIGPPDDLRELGIGVVEGLDAVGRGLVDHPAVSIDMAYAQDAPPVRLMQTVATLHSDGTSIDAPPDLQIFGVGPWLGEDSAIWILAGSVIKPRSRGRLWLRSADAADAPHIDLGYYGDATDDMARHVEVLGRMHAIVQAPELASLTTEVLNGPASDADADLEAHIRANAWTYHHPVGTCAMGSVVDSSGRVHGIEALSVIDASIMPDIPSANTHLPTVMIAERLAGTVLR